MVVLPLCRPSQAGCCDKLACIQARAPISVAHVLPRMHRAQQLATACHADLVQLEVLLLAASLLLCFGKLLCSESNDGA